MLFELAFFLNLITDFCRILSDCACKKLSVYNVNGKQYYYVKFLKQISKPWSNFYISLLST